MDDIIFVGDWVKERVLGSGSFGVVVLWKHKETGEKLAIKTCKWGDELTDKHKERWSKEVDMLKDCKNAHIVGTKDLPTEFLKGLERANPSGLPILCMEYCSGGDLRQVLNRIESVAGLKELEVRQILSDIGNAMEFLHQNKITHRDLKPENIVMKIIDDENNGGHPKVTHKLIDLGYAKEIDSKSVCASFVGTLQYLAPEILYSKTYSNSVDFWSFGLVAFEVVCGVRPFLPHMPPVQWMPHVKKKSTEHICIYETYHGDIENSNEVFSENHISTSFRLLLEKWLRVALEWDPKVRGRDSQQKVTFNLPEANKNETDFKPGNVIFFSLLNQILCVKILKIFSVYNIQELSYEINDSVLISTVKKWIERDTKIVIGDQCLISQLTYTDIADDEFAVKYWNDQSTNMIYVYHKNILIKENVQPKIPKPVQRCLEQPKALYNFKNSKDLYKCSYYLLISEKDLYENLVTGLFVKAESLRCEGKRLLLKHNSVDKNVGKLLTMEEILNNLATKGRVHIDELKSQEKATNCLGGFENLFNNASDINEKIGKLFSAWTQLTTRLQSAARRSNELIPAELMSTFVSKNNYNALTNDMVKSYINYKKTEREFRTMDKPCLEVVKINYNCLKIRDKINQDIRVQPFVLKLLDIGLEFSKISGIIDTAAENTDKLISDLSTVMDNLSECTWGTISLLSSAHNDLADIPYSVISFEKKDFKVGEAVTNHAKLGSKYKENSDLVSLIEESLKMRKDHCQLNNKMLSQKKLLDSAKFDFSFLSDNID